MSGRLCTESECTYTGQPAPKGCGCHEDYRFAAGQTVYDRAGRKLYFRRDLEDGTAIASRWLATETWDGESEEYVSDEPIILSLNGLFKSPPTEAVAAEVAKLNGEVETAREELSFIQHQAREAEAERVRTLASIKAIEPLRNIERFIAGEITHFLIVSESYGGEFYGDLSVEPFAKTMEKINDYGRVEGFKLLSLYGDSKGDLCFRVNHYCDGSGSWKRVVPCLSEDEAKATAAELLNQAWAGFDAAPQPYRLACAIKSAETLGLPVPEKFRAIHDNAVRGALKTAVEKAREALTKAEEQYARAQSTEEPKP
jgi:hypothetical protein